MQGFNQRDQEQVTIQVEQEVVHLISQPVVKFRPEVANDL